MIVNIVDASNLKRNLYLTFQLLEISKPTIIVLNMIDVAKRSRYKSQKDIQRARMPCCCDK
ncbi:FeoB small GTPase domain-containing protein [uncultured Campylobacter sp.]|uniref:FeoB small GTPase domain-containing protein n=1 Tax=uncultured Campylobacter sp. TaxID=218934 RepID=UPI00263359A5|nr:FeoB small GTPase domain-containing protein [uncultured Campylobacter sp.]